VARSERWNPNKSIPADLQQHEPELFRRYLHCVYRDEVPVPIHWNDEINPKFDMSEISYETEPADKFYEYLLKLYIMADSLQDPTTANLIIDKVRSVSQKACTPQSGALKFAFDHTLPGDPMRKVLADIFIFGGDRYGDDIDYPHDFLKLVVDRFRVMRSVNPTVQAAAVKVGNKTLWEVGDGKGGTYHHEEDDDDEDGNDMYGGDIVEDEGDDVDDEDDSDRCNPDSEL